MGARTAAFLFWMRPGLRNAAAENLKLAFPTWSKKQRRSTIRGMVRQVGWMAAEFAHFPRYTKNNIERTVLLDGFENFATAQAQGKGVLFLTGHMSAWEMAPFAQALYGNPLHFLVRPIDNPRVDALITKYRCLNGNQPIHKSQSARAVLKVLAANGTVGILADQNTQLTEGVFVDFFGIPACTTAGLAWVGNKAWYQCNGYVQSYVTDDGTASSPTPVQFAGHLDPGVGVNVMSSVLCTGTTDGSDCGFSRGLALHGFKGDAAGSKIFATKFRMPIGNQTPAYWILPAQVVRSSQYGCNCRGEGAAGGCGEIDVAEVLGGATASPAHPEQATTTIYSFQGVTGGGVDYFQRPVYETATFIVVFDAASSSIAERRLGATDFDFAGTIAAATVSGWLADAGAAKPMP